jgi:hypothetical protein
MITVNNVYTEIECSACRVKVMCLKEYGDKKPLCSTCAELAPVDPIERDKKLMDIENWMMLHGGAPNHLIQDIHKIRKQLLKQ